MLDHQGDVTLTFPTFPKASTFLACQAGMAEAAIFGSIILLAGTYNTRQSCCAVDLNASEIVLKSQPSLSILRKKHIQKPLREKSRNVSQS